MKENASHCRDLLVAHDYDRFVIAQAAPAPVRPDLYAVYAFNHEIAKTREVVTDPHAGYVRLAWWSELLAAFNKGTPMPDHAVAQVLGHAIRRHDLPIDVFEALIDARRTDLENTPPASLEGMAHYAAACNAPLVELAGRIAGEHNEDTNEAQSLGIAYGLTGLIRALPSMTARGVCHLPVSMVYDLGIMPEQIDRIGPSDKLSHSVKMIATLAQAYLSNTASKAAIFKKQKKLTGFYLKRIAAAGYNPFDPRVFAPVPFLGIRLWAYDQ